MIRTIKLKNFRAFQEEIEVRVRPITILIGRNSAGKSSVLKFLLMLRQTLDPGSIHASVLVTPGNGVAFVRRSASGGVSTRTGVSGAAPRSERSRSRYS